MSKQAFEKDSVSSGGGGSSGFGGYQEKNKNGSFKLSKIGEFCAETTCHGVNRFYQSDSSGGRTFWGIIICLTFILMIFTCVTAISRFMDRPTTIQMNVRQKDFMEFPDIVLCSIEPQTDREKYQRYNMSDKLYEYIRFTATLGYSWDIESDWVKNVTTLDDEYEAFFATTENLTGKDVRDFIHSLSLEPDEFFNSCQLGSRNSIWSDKEFNCSRYVRKVFDIKYGSCFLMNLTAGLDLNLLRTLRTFLPLAHGVAIRLMTKYHPHSRDVSYAAPGMLTIIDLVQEEEILTKSWIAGTSCKENTDISYDRKVCERRCTVKKDIEACGCSYANNPSATLEYSELSDFRVCTPREIKSCLVQQTINAMKLISGDTSRRRNVEGDGDHDECHEECEASCNQTLYRLHKATAKLEPGNSHPNFDVSDLVRIRFGFKKFEVESREEIVILTVDGLVSSIGGVMGVFLGSSIITIFEFVVFAAAEIWKKLNNAQRTSHDIPIQSSHSAATVSITSKDNNHRQKTTLSSTTTTNVEDISNNNNNSINATGFSLK